MASMRTIIAALFFVTVSTFSCNQPRPVQLECVKYDKLGCATCVSQFCGWCPNGCYSFSSPTICEEPIGFVQSCADGTAPFPDSVINPMPYGRSRNLLDAGADAR
jgi:hypothetical protein